ncbi:MAG: menaquinone biosynthesis decarboxylase [Actinomycetota bacterium]|nr:menaquinone biosynthesis decarboxylase [Actinomycetota bacterium]
MAPPADLREWIALLEREGELVRVGAEVDADLEITEIVDRVVKSGGPALLFEDVKGSRHPLLINQFGTERRMCLAFGAASLDDVARRLEDVLEMQPPQGLVEKVRGLKKLKSIADSQPRTVRAGPAQDVVLTGDDVDLDALPIQRCWPGDPAPFVTLPAVITRDPRTGTRNVGMYRMQKLDRRSTAMHWQIHKDGRMDYLATDGRLAVAVALGLDPVTAYAASAPLPKHIDELMLAGFLRGEAVELVKAKTVDLEVPANAEIVLEGYVQKDDLADEGPFGDHTGYYTGVEPFPVFHVTAVTMRRDAIYPSIVVGKPPQEDAWLGKATERIFLPAIRMTVPEIVDYDLPVAGAFHNCCIVSIRKAFPGHAQKVMHAIWGLGMLSLTKAIVVVDEHVDVHDYDEVLWYVGANVDPGRDVLLTEGPLDHLDHAPTRQFYGGKLGIDATRKGPLEGTREWPEEIVMSDDVRALVDRRWDEYGIDVGTAARTDGRRQSSRPLRRLLRR